MTRTATFLFTDLVGSTALSASLSPRDAEVVRQTHFTLLRAAVDVTGGVEVKNLGDGIMAVFESAAAAVDCAVDIQRRVDQQNRREPVSLAVRVGAAAGEAVEEGGDYFGDPVVEAARLCADAAGGQILVTSLVRALAGRRLSHAGSRVGERQLKGLPEPVDVWEIQWEPAPVLAGVLPLPPRLMAPAVVEFFGRSDALEAFTSAWKEAAGGTRRVLFVAGEPGIGKTRLCREVAIRAHTEGAIVLYGGFDDAVEIAYRPWIEVLEHLVTHATADMLEAAGGRRLADIARVVPAVRDRRPDIEPVRDADGEAERFQFFSAVAGVLAVATETAPVLMILDDLHWADRPSLALLRHVISAPGTERMLIVGTYRDAEIGVDHPLADALAASWRESGVDRLVLRGLDDVDVLALVAAATSEELAPDAVGFAHALHRETGGNPFYAWEVMRHVTEGDVDTGVAGVDGPLLGNVRLPESVREVVRRRVQRLGADTDATLSAAAVLGAEFELRLVAAVLEADVDDVLDRLERAEAANLVSAMGGGWFRFTHAIVQHTLYAALRPTRRARLHRAAAEALEALGRGDAAAAQLARHWTAAVATGDVDKAVDYSRRAGDLALASVAPDQAAEHYRQALELVRHHSNDPALEAELLCCIADALRLAGDPGYRQLVFDAADLAEAVGRTDLLVRAALTHYTLAASGYDADRCAVVERALGSIGSDDSPERARLLISLSDLTMFPDPPRSSAAAAEAAAVAERLGDRALLLEVASGMVGRTWDPATLPQALEMVELAREVGSPTMRARAGLNVMGTAYAAGRRDLVDEGRRLAQEAESEVRRPDGIWELRYYEADYHMMFGNLAVAEELAEESWELGRRTEQPGAFTMYAALLHMIRWHQGRAGEAVPLIEEAARHDPTMILLHITSDPRPLRERIPTVRDEPTWLSSMGLLGDLAVRAADRPVMAAVYEELLPHAAFVNKQGPYCRGPVSHDLAVLAAADGRRDDAERHFADADALNRRLGAPFYTARTLLEWGRRLHSWGERQRAAGVLEEATELALAHGYEAIQNRARGVLGRDVAQ